MKNVTLITGGAQGIGGATAVLMAKQGHNIALNYLNSALSAEATAKECRAFGADVLLLQADISNPVECIRIVAETIKYFGKIDLLVNNAGTTAFNESWDLTTQTPEMFRKIMDTNVLAPFMMCKEVAPHMLKQGHGVIVNISSNAAFNGASSSVAYATSKGALNTLTLAMASKLAPKIRVNSICPGVVSSTWWDKRIPDPAQRTAALTKMASENPLNKVVTPEEVAESVLFIFRNGSYNGEFLRLDCRGFL